MSSNVVQLKAEGPDEMLETLEKASETLKKEARPHITLDDLKELWGMGVLPDKGYVAILLMHLRMKGISEGKDPSNYLDIDIPHFIHLYGHWHGYAPNGNDKTKILDEYDLYKIVAELNKKQLWALPYVDTQLTLEFLGG
jgi:hypothetical protein